MMKYTDNQKKVLNLLLNKYEGSRTYQGKNQVQQIFAVTPESVWQDYTSDYTAVEQIRDFENEMQHLQERGLLWVRKKDNVICKLEASGTGWEEYYKVLGRKGKKEILQEQQEFYELWKNKNIPVILPFCKDQLERISGGKKPLYDVETSESLFRILEFMQKNQVDILERELSILLFADSKVFQNIYRSKVCKLICTYMNFHEKLQGIDEAKEQEKIILEEFNVYANPSYVYLKGECRLLMQDGRAFHLKQSPIAVSSEMLREVDKIMIAGDRIVTVENLTSFHRVSEGDCTYIYLAGYHNSVKQALLKKIFKENPGKQWFHFGDIDPDGFYILEHLKSGTGIDFQPMQMSVEELKKYSQYCKQLNENDRIKAKNLLDQGKYVEVLQYMLAENCKLEQEILGWNKGKP